MGCMGIIDLGPESGSEVFNSERRTYMGNIAGVLSIGLILYAMPKLQV